MFKWANAPSAAAPAREIADFTELLAWRDGEASMTGVVAAVNRLEENYHDGGVAEDDPNEHRIEEAFNELEFRAKACGRRGGYPFRTDKRGGALRLGPSPTNPRSLVYRFLLLATRLNMKDNRKHAGIDGAELFEGLSALVAQKYLGERAESLVFGTGSGGGGFRDKIDYLCKRMGEGKHFDGMRGNSARMRDGKLDAVAWKPFSDGRASKSILFGQCKTGTSYKDSLTHLHPDAFCDKWMRSPPALTPVRSFFLSEALSEIDWYADARDAGLLFDRCRMVDFGEIRDKDILARIRAWTNAATTAAGLPTVDRARQVGARK